jgi:hypothetical protein
LAQCFNNPIEQSLANELDPYPGPFNLVLCIHPPIPTPCVVPAVPTLESVPVGGSSATQEYILRAVQPPDDDVAFTSVFWSAHYFDPSNGWTKLWQVRSTDSMANIQQINGQMVASFGATGLKPGYRHQFQVSWCRAYSNQRGCICWSGPLDTVNPLPSTFPAVNPVPPASTVQRMEDNFARPYSTNPKRDPVTGNTLLGDGLGPDAAWQDLFYFPMGFLGNGSRIVKPTSGSSYAVMPQASLANYKVVIATHQHSYAEARWSLESSGARDNWNFDVHTRCHLGPGGAPRAYAVKFHRNQYGAASKPKLSIMRIVDGTPGAIASVEFTSDTLCTPWRTDDCTCMPGLSEIPSKAVWTRIEVEDTGSPARPDVRVTVAWDDSNLPTCGPNVTDCPHKCTLTKRDNTTLGIGFLGKLGEWGIDAHEGEYRISPFRAGNE